ncbi:MAG: SAM-dependent methyltransferase, partial [Pseudomonadota bacterium]
FGRRKCFMEAAFEGAMADGIDQVVIIGAGFDTLALRQAPAHRHVTFVEIDHPATQAAKRRGLQGVDLPANLVFLAADLGVTSLAEELERLELSGQYDRSKASFAILEGLLMYLSARDVRHVFQKLSVSAATGSRAAFSHLVSLNQHYVTQGIVRLMGEPWRSACRPDALSSYLPGPWQVTETAPLVTPRDLEGYAIAARNAA